MRGHGNKAIVCAPFASLFVFVTLFFGVVHPELLSYHEQYQLFLYSNEYFVERMAVAGGLADYVSEYLVQFYYVPWLGSMSIAAVLTLMMFLAYKLGGRCDDWRDKFTWALASAIAPLLVVWLMGDENVLLSFPVAIDIALVATLLFSLLPRINRIVWCVIALAVFTLLYWCVGAVAIIFTIIAPLKAKSIDRKALSVSASVVVSIAVVGVIGRMVLAQYPENQVFLGINYYRIANMHPQGMFVVVGWILGVWLLRCFGVTLLRYNDFTISRYSGVTIFRGVVAAVVLLLAAWFVPSGYDSEKFDALLYDKLVREGRWFEIISHAEGHVPQSEMALQGVNLALAKTGQLGNRMFQFPQQGMEGLIASHRLDNTSCLITAEVFYHLGMVNSSFRYYFDLQESIINNRKSGRFMKRMAECLIINGKYKAASKYTNKLKQSHYYREWARNTERLMASEMSVNAHPVYGEMRKLRFKQELLYNHSEVGKMIGLLAVESRGRNILAWDYFCASMLLKGDLQTLTGMYHYANELFHVAQIPRHHQEAIVPVLDVRSPVVRRHTVPYRRRHKATHHAVGSGISAQSRQHGCMASRLRANLLGLFLVETARAVTQG